MIEQEDIDKMLTILKEIKKEEAKTQKYTDKLCGNSLTRKQQNKISNEQGYIRHRINKLEHELHCLMVENNLSKPYGEDYYGDRLFYPDNWHNQGIKYNLRKPNNHFNNK